MRYKLLALCLMASACGAPQKIQEAAPSTPPSTVWQNTTAILPAPSQLTEITEAAVVTTPSSAQRADVQEQITTPPTPPPFDPVAYVNGLEYRAVVPGPAMEAYRVVATYYGWDEGTINARATFVQRIMGSESAYCWNARRWTYFTAERRCEEHKTGVYDDAGFGQITNVLRPLTCEKAGICSTADTVASPWNSMLAFVVVLTEQGKRPWCYLNNAHIRNGDCGTWPG